MECFPALSVDVENDALPLLSDTVLRTVVPSRNRTIPVALEDDNVAVNVTGFPPFDGFELDVSEIVVLAVFTVCESAEDVLPL